MGGKQGLGSQIFQLLPYESLHLGGGWAQKVPADNSLLTGPGGPHGICLYHLPCLMSFYRTPPPVFFILQPQQPTSHYSLLRCFPLPSLVNSCHCSETPSLITSMARWEPCAFPTLDTPHPPRHWNCLYEYLSNQSQETKCPADK